MFQPTFCPNRHCRLNDPEQVRAASLAFFIRCGTYVTSIPGSSPIQRWRCKTCRTSFSEQTFSSTYRQKKPQLNTGAWLNFSSGVSRRQSARILSTTRGTIERRFLWMASQSGSLHLQALEATQLRTSSLRVQFDEMESFATDRFHPISVPVMITPRSYFIVDSRVASIRRKGRLSPAQKAELDAIEKQEGRRSDTTVEELTALLQSLATLVAPRPSTTDDRDGQERPEKKPLRLLIETDQKPLYARLIRTVLRDGSEKDRRLLIQHEAYSGKIRRDNRNPLFSINHTNAEHRYHLSMLIRRTWSHAKRKEGLERHLKIYRVYRNFRRWVTNAKRRTPAMALGIAKRRLGFDDLFRWNREFTIPQLRALGAVAVRA